MDEAELHKFAKNLFLHFVLYIIANFIVIAISGGVFLYFFLDL